MRRWDEFKFQKRAPGVKLDESIRYFRAALASLKLGSWGYPQVKSDCKNKLAGGSEDIVCFPSTASRGYSVMTLSKKEAPVPSGVTEMDFAINVKKGTGNELIGRVESRLTLHYPGNPGIKLAFHKAPGVDKISLLKSFATTSILGGRYAIGSQNCHDTNAFQKSNIPWIPTDFLLHATKLSGKWYRPKCRMHMYPEKPTGTSDQQLKIKQSNINLAAANPIPNGKTLRRSIELVDGALIQNKFLFIIFREKINSFFGGSGTLSKDFVNYGYMMLERNPNAELEASDYKGVSPSGSAPSVSSKLSLVQCSSAMIRKAVNKSITNTASLRSWGGTNLNLLVNTLIQGPRAASRQKITPIKSVIRYSWASKNRYIHYLCEDTGFFNAGPNGNQSCPAGSKVVFFDSIKTEAQIKSDTCQKTKDCHKTLERWKKDSSQPNFRADVPYVCNNAQATTCDTNRNNLRLGKTFYKPTGSGVFVTSLKPMEIAIAEAFRFRVKFRSRNGKTIGFVPEICKPYSSGVTPYCYSPTAIEGLEQRVSCLQAIYTDSKINQKLSGTVRGTLLKFLKTNFSFTPSGSTIPYFGFEHMNAEIKIMMADEAYIQALTSRYDLAGTRAAAFDGTAFEFGGIKLSGTVGVMMLSLYKSTQYYQSVLDRFFSQSSSLALSFNSNTNFIDINVITTYFKKVIQASSRKARSWSRIAKEYHNMNRPDLAKKVVERAYATTYMEFVIFTRLMRVILRNAGQSEQDQIRKEIQTATLTYKTAMNDMQKVYKDVSQELNFFGFPAGYVPFPALSRFSATSENQYRFLSLFTLCKRKTGTRQNQRTNSLTNQASI